jgi:hypothetical protein
VQFVTKNKIIFSAFIGKIHEEEKKDEKKGRGGGRGRTRTRRAYFCKCDCWLVKYCNKYQLM